MEQQIIGPGQKLRSAREAKGLQIADVAEKLYLTKQRVTELEQNDFGKIVSLLHARGYLRAYAKLVDLPEDDVMSNLDKFGLLADEYGEPAEAISASGKLLMRNSRHYWRWLNLSFFLLLLVVVAFWWHDSRRVARKFHSFVSIMEKIIIPSRV